MKTNSLTYETTKTKGGIVYDISIRLNDECKNGHQDFAITGNKFEAGKPKTDRYNLGGGAIGDEIAKLFPEFKIFAQLHLCDYLGNPMHATANGFYHLKNGLGNVPTKSESFPSKFCEYYRIPLDFWETISKAQSQVHYEIIIYELGVPAIWETQAKEAIKKLEELTGNEFIIDSKRTQFGASSDDKIQEEYTKIASGYYSEGERAKRIQAQNDEFVLKLRRKAAEDIAAITKDLEIRIELYRIGGVRLYESVLYYKHNDTLGFNWRGYGEKIEESEAIHIIENSPLLSGMKYTMK